MTRKEAGEYANNMTYREAVYNALQGKCIPYRKATFIKLHELLNIVSFIQEVLIEMSCFRHVSEGSTADHIFDLIQKYPSLKQEFDKMIGTFS